MKALIFALLLQAQFIFSHELVWKISEHQVINKQLSSRPIYLKRKIIKDKKIERRELGFAQSPFYKSKTTFYRYYKKGVECYKLVVGKTANTVSKLKRCKNFKKNIYLNVAGAYSDANWPPILITTGHLF